MNLSEHGTTISPPQNVRHTTTTCYKRDAEQQRECDLLRAVGTWDPNEISTGILRAGRHRGNSEDVDKPVKFSHGFDDLFNNPAAFSEILAMDAEKSSPLSGTTGSAVPVMALSGPDVAMETQLAATSSALTVTSIPRPNTCLVCDRWFPSCELLERHARSAFHRIYVCPEAGCRCSYYRRDGLSRHKAKHNRSTSHVCLICAQAGHEKDFKRKDHLLQHLRNRHANIDHHRWCWDSVACLQGEYGFLNLEDRSTGFGSPLASGVLDEGRSLAEEMMVAEDDGTSSGSSCPSPSATDGNRAVTNLEVALTAIVGQNTTAISAIKDRLGLRTGATKSQMADSLKQLLVQPAPQEVEVGRM